MIELITVDNDIGTMEHLGDIMKTILGAGMNPFGSYIGAGGSTPSTLEPKIFGDHSFITIFFGHYIKRLLTIYRQVHDEKSADLKIDIVDRISTITGQNTTAVATSHRIVCEIMRRCIEVQSYRMRYFFLQYNFLKYLFCVFTSKHSHIHVGPIQVVRAILAARNEAYDKRIVKCNLLSPVLELLNRGMPTVENPSDNITTPGGNLVNLVSSCAAELFTFIITNSSGRIITYLMEHHKEIIKRITLGGIGRGIFERYEAIQSGSEIDIFQTDSGSTQEMEDTTTSDVDSGVPSSMMSSKRSGYVKSNENESHSRNDTSIKPRADADSGIDEDAYFMEDDDENMDVKVSGSGSVLADIRSSYGDSDDDSSNGGGSGSGSGNISNPDLPNLKPIQPKFDQDDTEFKILSSTTSRKVPSASSVSSNKGGISFTLNGANTNKRTKFN
jgi:hypothetical protein